jgi:hypothetical protein
MANITTKDNQTGTLLSLTDSSLTVANPDEDVRGRKVHDRQGENRVRFLRVAHGAFLGIGEEHFLVPVDAVTRIDYDHVHIDRERSKLSDVPGYNPSLAEAPDYYPGVYGWWGYSPYWAGGYAYPAYPVYPV